MFASFFLIASIIGGTALTYSIPLRLSLPERVFIGTAIGLASSTLLTFAVSLAFGFTLPGAGISAGLPALTAVAIALVPRFRAECAADVRRGIRALGSRTNRVVMIVFGVFAVALGLILGHAIFIHDGTLYAAFSNVWGDWNQHLSQTSSFAYADNIPPELSVLSGERLSYPFLTNFLSAILIKGGYSLVGAMVVPGVLLAIATLGLLMSLTIRLAGRLAGVFAPFLFFLGGGLGFLRIFQDFIDANQSLGQFFGHLTRNYTQTKPDEWLGNISWINPIYAYVVPQRAFIFGAPLVLAVLLLVHAALRERRRRLLLPAGMIVALLPLIHTHALVFFGFITPVLILLTSKRTGPDAKAVIRYWMPFLVPIALVALPQFLWLTYGLSTGRFLRLQLGWTTDDGNVVWFWLKNMSLFLPLLGIGMVAFRRSQPLLTTLTASIAVVFVLANIIIFQPWDWDNSKLFVYWFLASIPMVAFVLAAAWRRSPRWRIGTVLLLLSLTLSGALDASKALQWQSYKLPMFSKDDRVLAEHIRTHSSPDSVFLTAQDANNPISGLSGRSIVLGYTGWIWSYGLDYLDREKDVTMMMEARTDPRELLRRYDVDYVVIGAAERGSNRFTVNERYYKANFRTWYTNGTTVIYDVSAPVPTAG